MIKIHNDLGQGFFPSVISDTWRLCYVSPCEQYGEPRVLKRHNDTDEAFLLIRGEAELFTFENGTVKEIPMKQGIFYNIEKGTWHHLRMGGDAFLIAAENRDVSPENTERMEINNA